MIEGEVAEVAWFTADGDVSRAAFAFYGDGTTVKPTASCNGLEHAPNSVMDIQPDVRQARTCAGDALAYGVEHHADRRGGDADLALLRVIAGYALAGCVRWAGRSALRSSSPTRAAEADRTRCPTSSASTASAKPGRDPHLPPS